jgi:hypothetical protein
MEKFILLMVAAILQTSAYAQSNTNTVVINKPKQVTIITGDSIQKVIVKGRENDDSYEYISTIQLVDSNYVSKEEINKDSWTLKDIIPSVSMTGSQEQKSGGEVILGGPLMIGFTAPTHTDSGTDFSTFRSWEFAIPFIEASFFFDKKHRNAVALQTFFNWRNYRMTGDTRFVKNERGNVELASYPEGAKPKFSRVKVFSLSGALLYSYSNKHWGFSLGPVINFNTYASIKTRYSIDRGKYKDVDKHINQRKVTFDIMGVFETPGIDLYLKYSPNDVLKDGVKFRSLTFGLCL